MFKFAALLGLASLLPVCLAQSPIWGQCGGIGWSGPTVCAQGSSCVYSNPYFSHCNPDTPTSSSVVTSYTSSSSAPPTGPTGSSGDPSLAIR